MPRSALILVLTAATALTACSGPATSAPEAADRLAVIKELRGIDVCALYADAESVDGQPLTIKGFGSALNCEATVEDPAGTVDATIALNIGPSQPAAEEPSWIRNEVIDGVNVTIASSADQPDAPPREEMVAWSCELAASYPDNARLSVSVMADPDVDGCAVAETLMRTAIRTFEQRPSLGSSGQPSAILSGADPCAPAERLRATHAVDIAPDDVTVNSCMFTVDGGPPVDVSFSYQAPELVDVYPDQFSIGGHRVAGDQSSGVFDVVVGDVVQSARGPVLPLVSVVEPTQNMDLIRQVAQAVADQF
ncbi:hypothetical protein [Mycolicibacterium frederiksbergense]|uniref:DUF3558 domain-containing protein n=1 Tax=Mycolicibacterium frederiksbergense TaxID=117567 RepID=A0A6H0RX57_9MYCO|nr:hypothetical protein [Mycolicibacterium frederiksbergense]QIV79496.1 hypothetical protein EXE63_00125 [Mycolicibacterium frederiksbergense]